MSAVQIQPDLLQIQPGLESVHEGSLFEHEKTIAVSYRSQGNDEFYSDDNLKKRSALRQRSKWHEVSDDWVSVASSDGFDSA